MIFSTTELGRYAPLPGPIGPAMADWLKRSLRQLAGRRQPAPEPVRDRVREAAEVREWAMTLQRSDPGFAADLLAAADRHERHAR
jgi:hypothetical protein